MAVPVRPLAGGYGLCDAKHKTQFTTEYINLQGLCVCLFGTLGWQQEDAGVRQAFGKTRYEGLLGRHMYGKRTSRDLIPIRDRFGCNMAADEMVPTGHHSSWKEFLKSFTVWFPVMDIVFWAAFVIVPIFIFFMRLKHAANGSPSVHLSFGNLQAIIPSNRFLAFSINRAVTAEKSITILDAPAKFVEVAVSLILFRTGNWHPISILPGGWRSLIYPIYALPAWIYVGRGVDALLGRHDVRRSNLIASLTLALFSIALCCIFTFGFSPAERQDDNLLDWYGKGFALWAILFALPFAAWLRRKIKRTPPENPNQPVA